MRIQTVMDASHELYRWRKDLTEKSAYICPKCYSSLSVMYLEERIYIVSCGECPVIHLVQADSPTKAVKIVGVKDEPK